MKKATAFDILRLFSIVTLVCTVGLTIFIFAEALTPGDQSSAHSAAVADSIKNVIDVNDNNLLYDVRSLDFSYDKAIYAGDDVSFSVTFAPNGTEGETVLSSEDESVATITDDGKAHFLKAGSVWIRCALSSDPSIYARQNFTCFGTDPKDIVSLSLAKPCSIPVGQSQCLSFLDQNGDEVLAYTLDVRFADQSLLRSSNSMLTALKPGTTTATASCIGKDGATVECNFTVDTLDDPSFLPPQEFVYTPEVNIKVGETFSVIDHVTGTTPQSSVIAENYTRVLQDENGALSPLSDDNRSFKGAKRGTAYIDIRSIFNADCVGRIVVTVTEPVPTSLTLIGKNRVCVDDTNSLDVFGDTTYITDVTWTVVKGKAELLGDGVYRAKRLGTLVLRATSNADPELYADFEIRVSLFSNFNYFVRKVIGHFGLFFVLGVGISVSLYLLFRPRALYIGASFVLAFVVALISEVFQMPLFTADRFASWTDVTIDFSGAAIGIMLSNVAIAIFIAIRRKFKGYDEFKESLSLLSFRTLFAHGSKLRLIKEECSAEYVPVCQADEQSDRTDDSSPVDSERSQT